MDESPWNEILFFPGEDAEAIKTRFVETWAKYQDRAPYEIAAYVFKDLRDPSLRQGKAAEVWAKDLDVLERVRLLVLKGPPIPDCSEMDLIRRALAVADNPNTQPKDIIAAIRVVGEFQGTLKKSSDNAKPGANDNSSLDFFAALSARLPN
jgi:hypothetical protein